MTFLISVLLFTVPGLAIYLLCLRTTKTALAIALPLSLSYWVVVFSLLKIIPLSLPQVAGITFIVAGIIIARHLTFLNLRSFWLKIREYWWLPFICLLYMLIYIRFPLPSGADMATHTYTAKVIVNNHGFYPTTFYPLVPINHFGFAPTGMPSLIALLTMVSNKPIYRIAVLIVSWTYITLALSLYLYLRHHWKPWVSLLALLSILFLGYDIHRYIVWGGNPTILAVAFLAAGIYLVQKSWSKPNLKINIVSASFFAASFYTHPTPFVTFLHFVMLLIIYALIKKKKFLLKQIITLLLLTGFLLIPFALSVQPLTKSSLEHINQVFLADYLGLVDKNQNIFILTANFFIERTSLLVMCILLVGSIIAYRIQRVVAIWLMVALALSYFLVVNSQLKILPWYYVLYPDRVLTTATLVLSMFLAAAWNSLVDVIKIVTRRQKKQFLIYLVIPALIPILYVANQTRINVYKQIFEEPEHAISVTNDDFAVMSWISNNLPADVVIANNYGDAGIWIPVITNRTVNNNDTYAQYLNEVREGQSKLHPEYLFVGSRIVYPDGIRYFKESLNPKIYQKVFSSENTVLFKIL